MKQLAKKHKRYGYRRITALLRREGRQINVKRVYRIWKQEGLTLPRKRPKRRATGSSGGVAQRAEYPDHVWSYDFVEDRTEKGKTFRNLTIVDEFTRENLAIHVATSIPSRTVIQVLEWLFLTRGVPKYIRSDNGTEFIAQALQDWLKETKCQTLYIQPGSPWENPYIESFNGKFRDECLNQHWFRTVQEAQRTIEEWREEYNHQRPHSSLGYMTPVEFAAAWVVDRAGLDAPDGKPCRVSHSRLDNSSSCPQALGELLLEFTTRSTTDKSNTKKNLQSLISTGT